ncbi:hypothetical protein GCM10011492_44060 [Flexivirga endophytica]|uniref:DinB family protein n=1 Tax=Flexivirga endophytica TaxID=1849103 RepID=A0A916TJA1_9MICO|nr:hypothetical protein GCM10011492_44060 [Flexivirga endophytica]GHB60975.1 hypothetical protein GCM10008112_32450 [Flexivirga endophytica]
MERTDAATLVYVSYGWRDFGTGHLDEVCDECGFDSRCAEFDVDLRTAIAALCHLAGDSRAGSRPEPGTWSADEYVAHCLDQVGEAISVIDNGRPEPKAVVSGLEDADHQVKSLLSRVAGTDSHRQIDVGGPFPASPAWMLAHLLHDLEHHVLDIRRGYAKLGLERVAGRTIER